MPDAAHPQQITPRFTELAVVIRWLLTSGTRLIRLLQGTLAHVRYAVDPCRSHAHALTLCSSTRVTRRNMRVARHHHLTCSRPHVLFMRRCLGVCRVGRFRRSLAATVLSAVVHKINAASARGPQSYPPRATMACMRCAGTLTDSLLR